MKENSPAPPVLTEPRDVGEDPSVIEELDLTSDAPVGNVHVPSTVPYDPNPEREKIRGWIALGLVGLLGVVVLTSFVVLITHQLEIGPLKDLLGTIFSPLVALVGAATGFYFGSRGRT